MNKSASVSTNSLDNPVMNQHSFRSGLWIGALFLLGCAAYSLPWLANHSTGLSFGAYDLAEWASLHPTVRAGNPTLLASFLLRLPLACLGLLGFIGIFRANLWLRLSLLMLIGIALLPPLEFFTQYRDDPNYRQQFFLAVSTVLFGILSMSLVRRGYIRPLVITFVLIGAISSLWGLLQGYSLMTAFNLPTRISFGGIALLAIYTLTGYILLRGFQPLKKQGNPSLRTTPQ
jgi:hypothetical protein